MPAPGRVTRNQTVPEDFRTLLQEMRKQRDPRLPIVLRVARLNGWTLQSLGDAIGVTREWIRLLVADAKLGASMVIPDVPLPPRRPTPERKPRKPVLRVKPEVAERLRAMAAIAGRVNGGTPADAPERRVSEEFSAMLNSLVHQGVSVNHLARVLDLFPGAINSRLARHGYREPCPSQEGKRYLGHPRNSGMPQEACKRGHPLSGDNLYVVPKTGQRVCRECSRLRTRNYLARKAATQRGGGTS